MWLHPPTEDGEITDSGVHAVQLVEVEPRPEPVFVTTLPLPMVERIVLDLKLKLNLVTSHHARLLSTETGEFLEHTVHALDHVEVDSKCELEPVTTLPLRMEVHPVLVVKKNESPVIQMHALSMETGDLLERMVHALDHVEVDSRRELEPVTTLPLRMEVQPVLVVMKNESPVIQLHALY